MFKPGRIAGSVALAGAATLALGISAARGEPAAGGRPIPSVAVAPPPAVFGWDRAKLEEFERYAFSDAEKFRTDALLVIAGGKTLIERYGRGYRPEMRHYGWSVTKSVAMAIFGVAEADGYVSREDPVSKWEPSVRGTRWDGIHLQHLLSMSSGVEWREGYETSPFDSHVVSALYRTAASRDFGLLPLRQSRFVAPPGERFNYSSGDTNLMMRILKRALGERYADYPWERLFKPAGMDSVVLERDQTGTFIGSSYMSATPRDFARFGRLFLDEGRAGGRQVLPKEWIALASTPSPAMSHLRLDHTPPMGYGHGWWINRPNPGAQLGKTVADLPADAYLASGHDGQEIYVVPSWDLVVVRMANDRFGERMALARIGAFLKAARR